VPSAVQEAQHRGEPSKGRTELAQAASRPAPRTITGSSPYAVEGLHLGVRLSKASDEYGKFRCVPSEQFAGHTWCTRQQPGSESRGKFEATYSLLHAADGTIVYVNRFQAPAYWTGNEVDDDIQRQAKKIGTEPNILKLPAHSGPTKGTIATWGKLNLQLLDPTSIAALAEGRSVKKGLLVDYIGDFTRSARAGLPIYQISGGAGFGWIASYDANGRGTLRFFAADASAFTERQQQVPNVAAPLPSQEDRQRWKTKAIPALRSQALQPRP